MKPFRLAPKASADLDQIAAFIARDNPIRAATFVEELLSVCRRIPAHPENYPRRSHLGPGMRVAIHKSYLVFFTIIPTKSASSACSTAHAIPRVCSKKTVSYARPA